MTTRDPLIIGLCGRAGAGKDTIGEYLNEKHGFECYAFADPIRNMLSSLMADASLDYEFLFDRALKEAVIPELGVSARRLMQTLGTEWGRQLQPDFWLRIADLTLGLAEHAPAPIHDRIVITDVRFPNEAAWIEKHRGFVVRVTRHTPQLAEAHVSETHIDAIEPWSCFDNAGSLLNLRDQVDDLMRQLEQQP